MRPVVIAPACGSVSRVGNTHAARGVLAVDIRAWRREGVRGTAHDCPIARWTLDAGRTATKHDVASLGTMGLEATEPTGIIVAADTAESGLTPRCLHPLDRLQAGWCWMDGWIGRQTAAILIEGVTSQRIRDAVMLSQCQRVQRLASPSHDVGRRGTSSCIHRHAGH